MTDPTLPATPSHEAIAALTKAILQGMAYDMPPHAIAPAAYAALHRHLQGK